MPSLISEGGFSLAIPNFPSRFGTARTNHIRVRQGMGVAEHQFTLSAKAERHFLQDSGSGIPTIVNGKNVTSVELKPGDRIHAGKLSMIFSASDTLEGAKPPPPPAPAPTPKAEASPPPATSNPSPAVGVVAIPSTMEQPDISEEEMAAQFSHFSGIEPAVSRIPTGSEKKAKTGEASALPAIKAPEQGPKEVPISLPTDAFQRRLARVTLPDAPPKRSIIPWKTIGISLGLLACAAGAWAGWKGIPVFETLQGRLGLMKKPPHTPYLAQILNEKPSLVLQLDLDKIFAKYNSYAPNAGAPTILEVQRTLGSFLPSSITLTEADRLILAQNGGSTTCLITFKEYLKPDRLATELRKGAKSNPETVAGRQVHNSFLFNRGDLHFSILDDRSVLFGDKPSIKAMLPFIIANKPASPEAKNLLKDIGDSTSLIGMYANVKQLGQGGLPFGDKLEGSLTPAMQGGMKDLESIALQFNMNEAISLVSKTRHDTPQSAEQFATEQKAKNDTALAKLKQQPGLDQDLLKSLEILAKKTGFLVNGQYLTMTVRLSQSEFNQFGQVISKNSPRIMEILQGLAAGEKFIPRPN